MKGEQCRRWVDGLFKYFVDCARANGACLGIFSTILNSQNAHTTKETDKRPAAVLNGARHLQQAATDRMKDHRMAWGLGRLVWMAYKMIWPLLVLRNLNEMIIIRHKNSTGGEYEEEEDCDDGRQKDVCIFHVL